MHLKRLELNGFKSFAKKSEFVFDVPIIAVVGPNGSGKSNVVEAIRFVLGEQSVKSMRGKTGSDLIFKGSKDITQMSRASVSIVFDNTDRVFYLHNQNNSKISVDFDEVAISREVFADGSNTYMINGHDVRMKDVHELIASVNIGASGHHIISQGEADRYLNANLKDRRELIEEALGLRVYQYRIKESRRKLERAEANIHESELLRRELAPHIKFLKREVEKIQKAKDLRSTLLMEYKTYLACEDYLIRSLESQLDSNRSDVQTEYTKVQEFLSQHASLVESKKYPEEESLLEKNRLLRDNAEKALQLRQELGRIEGMISLLRKQQEKDSTVEKVQKQASFSFGQIETFITSIIGRIEELDRAEISFLPSGLESLKKYISGFIQETPTQKRVHLDNSQEISELAARQTQLNERMGELACSESSIQDEIQSLQKMLDEKRAQTQESQKQYYEYLALKKELDGRRALIANRDEVLGSRIHARTEEEQEACVLLCIDKIEYQKILAEEQGTVTTQSQEQSRRQLERAKIRLEDMGGASGVEVINEFEETKERDDFLEKEIIDIRDTIESLNKIIADLKLQLDTEFSSGLKKINQQFDKFFKLMFGGGRADLDPAVIKKRKKKSLEGGQLELIETEDDTESQEEYGIDINVQLPRKKVTDLDMLSGGERSLTSIALLFALSQVNPPPFLVLDETDAALDEANSKKYGDMIESLSAYSQLVVVTHNRETMSRAQTLFGVTLGRDDSSSVLSLRLEDAAKYAK